MKNYLITEEMAKEYGIPMKELSRVFSYNTFEDMENCLEELGYERVTKSKMDRLQEIITFKYEDDILQRMISYL
ncbi:MAG: hypothetical protein ACRCU6_05680, partial [Fusobacteriaceae bacterium]